MKDCKQIQVVLNVTGAVQWHSAMLVQMLVLGDVQFAMPDASNILAA